MTSKSYRCALLATLVLLAAAAPAASQVELIEPDLKESPDQFQELVTLYGQGCAVRYGNGALDRAHWVLRRLELLTTYFNKWSEVPVPTAIFVLDRDLWRRAGYSTPYGFPLRIGPNIVLAPALGDDLTVRMWKRVLGVETLPMIAGRPVVGTAEHAATLSLGDVLLQSEAARGFTQRAGLLGDQAWIGDLMAHVAANVVFSTHETQRMPEIGDMYARMEQRLGRSGGQLGDYSPLLALGSEEDVRRWLWFQAKLHNGARIMVEKDGRKAVKRLMQLSRKQGGELRAALLFDRYPGLRDWARSFPVAAPAASGNAGR
ncbi:MAG: hypothetical protein AAGA81_24355 [Acidobacteriota bacterium]